MAPFRHYLGTGGRVSPPHSGQCATARCVCECVYECMCVSERVRRTSVLVIVSKTRREGPGDVDLSTTLPRPRSTIVLPLKLIGWLTVEPVWGP